MKFRKSKKSNFSAEIVEIDILYYVYHRLRHILMADVMHDMSQNPWLT